MTRHPTPCGSVAGGSPGQSHEAPSNPGAPARPVEALLANARANLVVRDGFASFFFHPQFDVAALQAIVAGVRDAGYVFVSPADLSFPPAARR